MIQESAIAVVDEDSTGVVEFHEFVHLLTIYMKTEGFTRHLAHKRAGISKRFSEKSHSYAWGRNFSTKQQLLDNVVWFSLNINIVELLMAPRVRDRNLVASKFSRRLKI